MNGTWPIVYKIDDSHLVVESTCLDPQTGNILWTSTQFSADTGALFVANVYSSQKKKCFTLKLVPTFMLGTFLILQFRQR